jgi:hypothetical protein
VEKLQHKTESRNTALCHVRSKAEVEHSDTHAKMLNIYLCVCLFGCGGGGVGNIIS